jgi:hypothetical protein
MNLDTYESGAIPDVFVTIPSAGAAATIASVKKLAALRLRLVRARYTLRSNAANAAFVKFVGTQIASSGYALHGFDLACEQPAGLRVSTEKRMKGSCTSSRAQSRVAIVSSRPDLPTPAWSAS